MHALVPRELRGLPVLLLAPRIVANVRLLSSVGVDMISKVLFLRKLPPAQYTYKLPSWIMRDYVSSEIVNALEYLSAVKYSAYYLFVFEFMI